MFKKIELCLVNYACVSIDGYVGTRIVGTLAKRD